MHALALLGLHVAVALGQQDNVAPQAAAQQMAQQPDAVPQAMPPPAVPLAMPPPFVPGQQQQQDDQNAQPPPTALPMDQTLEGLDGINYAIYQTEPNLRTPILKIHERVKDLRKLQPGYLMFDPMTNTNPPGLGPLMYNTHTGELVWDGKPWTGFGAWATQNSHVCDFRGEKGNHICYTESYHGQSAHHRVFNHHYKSVEGDHGFNGTGRFPVVNGHEFDMNDGGMSFQQLIYYIRPVDTTSIRGKAETYIQDACMQEVDSVTGEEMFAWCGTENGLVVGEGTHKVVPQDNAITKSWDFAHANSIDKNDEGDFIMSIRYFNQVWKIAGPDAKQVHGIEPGTVIWKLGVHGDFKIAEDETFYHQHDARFVSTGARETLISMFDNHNTGNMDKFKSAGKAYKLNNETMTATLVSRWDYPEPEPCVAMGSMRLQPNGNALIAWGQRPFFSEMDAQGKLLLHASFKDNHDLAYNYRVLKSAWVGRPLTRPKVIAYSLSCDSSQVVVYASWNGATEVQSWRLSVSTSPSNPWVLLGIFPKTGFETRMVLEKYVVSIFSGATPRHIQAEALDADGNVLAAGDIETFVPRPEIVQSLACDIEGCHGPKHFLYESSQNFIHDCKPGQSMSWSTVLSIFLGIEGTLYLYRNAHALFRSDANAPRPVRRGILA